jgi:hypothetical protein
MPTITDELLFKVQMGSGGHEYMVYTSGRIEGFGEGAIVCNYYPQLLASVYVHASGANGIASDLSCPTSRRTADLAGAAHATPEYPASNGITISTAPGEK